MGMSPRNPLRWGILSTARIGRQNWRAILRSGQNVVTAVASRDPARAQAFIDENQSETPMPESPRAFGRYEDLIACPEVDAIYLPLPTGLRSEWVRRAARAGKHVLAEKPCARNAEELSADLAACRASGVQYMDGVMFMHHPRLAHLGQLLHRRRALGGLRRVDSCFSFAGGADFTTENIRAQSALEPLGCLGDLGWYCLRLSLWAMEWRLPTRVRGHALTSHAGVPMEFSGELAYADGTSCGFFCSFHSPPQQWAQLSGTVANLGLDDFVHAREPDAARYTLNHQPVLEPCATDRDVAAHEVLMFRNFAAQIASGTLNPDWPLWSLLTQLCLDACQRSATENGRAVEIEPLPAA